MLSVVENTIVKQSIPAQSISAATVNGASVDAAGWNEVGINVNFGTVLATGTMDVHVEDSADDTTFADITGAVFTQVLPANDNQTLRGKLKPGGFRRYVRVVATAAVAAGVVAADIELGQPLGKLPSPIVDGGPSETLEFEV
jgi:hypothetical protein